MRLEAFVGDDAGLGEAVHPFPNLDEYTIVGDQVGELVLYHNIRWNVSSGDPHVLETFHRIIKVKIFNIEGCKLGVGRGQDAIKEEFGGGQVGGFCGDRTRKHDTVAAAGEPDPFLFRFVRFQFGDHA